MRLRYTSSIKDRRTKDNFRDLENKLGFAAAKVTKSTGQSVASGGTPQLTWDTVLYDPTGMFRDSTDDFLIAVPGLYIVTVNVQWATGSATGARGLALQKNSDTVMWGNLNQSGPATDSHRNNMTEHFSCVAGDVIKAYVYQSSGGAITVQTGETRFMITQVSA